MVGAGLPVQEPTQPGRRRYLRGLPGAVPQEQTVGTEQMGGGTGANAESETQASSVS